MSLFNDMCKIEGLKIVRPYCSDLAHIIGRCAFEGAEARYLLQKDGIARFDGASAEIILDLGQARDFDTVVIASTNATPDVQVKIEASDDLGSFFNGANAFYNEQSEIYGDHEFEIDCDKDWPFEIPSTMGQSLFTSGSIYPLCPDTNCDANYIACGYEPNLIMQSPSLIKGMRYIKITIFDPSNKDGFIQAARLMIDQAWQGDCDVAAGWGVSVVDTAQNVRTRTGKMICGCGTRWREFEGTYNFGCNTKDLFGWDLRYGACQELFIIPPVENACDSQSYSFWAHPKDISQLTHVRCGKFSKAVGFAEVRGFTPCVKQEDELERILEPIPLAYAGPDGVARSCVQTDRSGLLEQPIYSVYTTPENGTASIDPSTGEVEYLANDGFSGIDCFEIAGTLPNGQADIEEVCVNTIQRIELLGLIGSPTQESNWQINGNNATHTPVTAGRTSVLYSDQSYDPRTTNFMFLVDIDPHTGPTQAGIGPYTSGVRDQYALFNSFSAHLFAQVGGGGDHLPTFVYGDGGRPNAPRIDLMAGDRFGTRFICGVADLVLVRADGTIISRYTSPNRVNRPVWFALATNTDGLQVENATITYL